MNEWRNIKIFQDCVKTTLNCSELTPFCCCLAEDAICFGHSNGTLQLLELKNGEQVAVFPSLFSRCITHISYIQNKRVIVCVGTESNDDNPSVKLCSIKKSPFFPPTHDTSARLFCEKVNVFQEHKLQWSQLLLAEQCDEKSPQISSVAAASDLSAIALKFDNSAAVFTGDFNHVFDTPFHIKSRCDKGRLVFISLCSLSKSPQKGLFISEDTIRQVMQPGGFSSLPLLNNSKDLAQSSLYTVYESSVSIWWPHGSGEYTEMVCPVPFGASEGCAATFGDYGGLAVLNQASSSCQLAIIGNRSGIPFNPTSTSSVRVVNFSLPSGRIPRQIECFKDYMCIVSYQPEAPSSFFLQCLDCTHFISCLGCSQPRFNNCEYVLTSNDRIAIITKTIATKVRKDMKPVLQFRAYILKEQSPMVKLGLFLEKEVFDVAKELATEVSNGSSEKRNRLINVVAKLYGDYLYNRGLFSKAMEQYLDTIGFQETSYVIVRYLKSKYLPDLTRYLEKLVSPTFEQCFSLSEFMCHVQLLLYCYMKQGLHDRSNHLLAPEGSARITPELVIQTLREGKCFPCAREMAQKHKKYLNCFQIAFFDLNKTKSALQYLHFIPLPDALNIASRYGREIVCAHPQFYAQLIVHFSLEWRNSSSDDMVLTKIEQQDALLHLAYFLVDYPVYLRYLLHIMYQHRLFGSPTKDFYSSQLSDSLLFSFFFLLTNDDSSTISLSSDGPPKENYYLFEQNGSNDALQDIVRKDSTPSREELALKILHEQLVDANKYRTLLLCHVAGHMDGKKTISSLLDEKQQQKNLPSFFSNRKEFNTDNLTLICQLANDSSSSLTKRATDFLHELNIKNHFKTVDFFFDELPGVEKENTYKTFSFATEFSTDIDDGTPDDCRNLW